MASREPAPGENRLAFERSPYLLQHARNPVDWYPWGDAAFERARREDKPIFLSIGYSTCHWCHVMEHESFENAEIAALMNETFVCVKVDREERPDIDNVYMAVCQMMTGRGGWPMTILMTADKKPFFAGTYIPPQGMLNLLPQVQALWTNEREKVTQESDRIAGLLEQSIQREPGDLPAERVLNDGYRQMVARYDSIHGGFGDRPKFPTPHNLLFILRYWEHSRDPQALEMVERTLEMMRRGGVYDHIGYGFHRYSTDDRWFLPHFEKMLYDQALMAMAYTDAWQATGQDKYRTIANEIYTYVVRDMTDVGGGFYSAEDADSEGEEGKFYLWSEAELRSVLGPDADLAIAVFGVTDEGNYHEEASGHRPGTNILFLPRPLTESAIAVGVDSPTLVASLERIRARLFDVREKRIHPGKDDKILADWNGLMIAALARSGRAFGNAQHTEAAIRSAKFVLEKMRAPDGGILHRFRDGHAGITGMLDDYAFMTWGLLELYESTFDLHWLEEAIRLASYQHRNFHDETDGGYYFTARDGEPLLVRSKEIYDGAVPSGNSVTALNFVRIGRITGMPEWEQRAEDIARAFSNQLKQAPGAHTLVLVALDFMVGPSYELVLSAPRVADVREMAAAIDRGFFPRKVVLFRPDAKPDPVIALAPFTREQRPIDGKPTAYVCRNHACDLPTTDVSEVLKKLGAK